jgi:hypothetical protein
MRPVGRTLVCAVLTAVVVVVLNVRPVEAAGSVIISEFRLQGPGGIADEFIEIYNDSDTPHTVVATSGTGYAIAASDGVVRCTIPNGTVIPARGHWLCANTQYQLNSYPSGSGTTATGDGTYPLMIEIPLNAGVALFNNNAGGGSFSLANRFDAVGSTAETNGLYKEGTGYPPRDDVIPPQNPNYSYVRDECGKGGAVNLPGPCSISTPTDTDSNADDFYLVEAVGTFAVFVERLGAPGPQNLSSPIQRNATVSASLLDATLSSSSAPNRVRDFIADPPGGSTFGNLYIRRRFVNNTGAPVTRLRFRIIDLSTFPAAPGFADLRLRTSVAEVVAGIDDAATCAAAGQAPPDCVVTVQGSTLEQAAPPSNQPFGGGFNSSFGAGTVTLGTPLASGASITLQFRLGIQQTGSFRIWMNIEALP